MNTNPQFIKYLNRVVDTYDANYPTLRWGQVYFNVLHEIAPNLAMVISKSELEIDPYHHDSKIPQFLNFVHDKWGVYD